MNVDKRIMNNGVDGRDTADVYTRVAVARPSSQLGRVNPRIVRDAQSQSAVKQQDLTIDKAEDQLRGTTGRRPDYHCGSPALWICVCRIWEYLMLLFRQRVLAHSLFPSLYPFLS